MKVLVDALGAENENTGVTQYALHLLRELVRLDAAVHYLVLVRPSLESSHEIFRIGAENANVTFVRRNIPPIGPVRDLKFLTLRGLLGCDLYHCLSSNFPLSLGSRSVVTIHDLKYLLYPEYLGKFRRLKVNYLRATFGHAGKHAARLIAVSESTRADFIRLFGASSPGLPARILTIHEASCLTRTDRPEVLERYGLAAPYFLYVGELRPHKNVDGLLSAFERFLESTPSDNGIELVVAGKMHASFRRPAKVNYRVRFIGYVPDAELFTLYKNALAFCLVSNYEGFGLPVLEAMDAGVPVIASNESATREIALGAALLVNPADADEVAAAMQKMNNDTSLRESLIAKGIRRAADFSWRAAAVKTLALYREITN